MRLVILRSQRRFLLGLQETIHRCFPIVFIHIASGDAIDVFSTLPERRKIVISNNFFPNNLSLRYFTDIEKQSIDTSKLSTEDVDKTLLALLADNKEREIMKLLNICHEEKIAIGKDNLKKLFRGYSMNGKLNKVEIMQKYCARVLPAYYEYNGEFLHYIAKAHCMKGNSEKGLSILTNAYKEYKSLRGFYRVIFKELIHDSVRNRSEATLVIFKKYVLEFSQKWNDNYPLICFWHICWKSDWFSDQMLADELLDASKQLQNIIKDMATTLCLSVLREYNDDAATRFLQILLKYKMMDEYVNTLQIFFNYKLKNKDIRGCTEILRNCEALGVSLPAYQHKQFIKMMIKREDDTVTTPAKTEDFKLKF